MVQVHWAGSSPGRRFPTTVSPRTMTSPPSQHSLRRPSGTFFILLYQVQHMSSAHLQRQVCTRTWIASRHEVARVGQELTKQWHQRILQYLRTNLKFHNTRFTFQNNNAVVPFIISRYTAQENHLETKPSFNILVGVVSQSKGKRSTGASGCVHSTLASAFSLLQDYLSIKKATPLILGSAISYKYLLQAVPSFPFIPAQWSLKSNGFLRAVMLEQLCYTENAGILFV